MVGSAVTRQPAVAGAFYPAGRERLAALVASQLAEADRRAGAQGDAALSGPAPAGSPTGILVPHAGLEYSGIVAASAWRLLRSQPAAAPTSAPAPPTLVLLGTNHRAGWLDGLAAWDRGAWRTPLGDIGIDDAVAAAILELDAPFVVDREAHLEEHSIEVQLPFLATVAAAARIVPLAVSIGIGPEAIAAGGLLGTLLGRLRSGGTPIVLAVSSDMAHYPSATDAERVTADLLPAILALDAAGLGDRERSLREEALSRRGPRGLACGMCGIEPAVVGLAALRAMGATRGTALDAATSADAGGPRDRTVGYLAVRFD